MSETKSIAVVLGHHAYMSGRAYTALNFINTALLEGHTVKVFLFEEGIFLAKKGQNPGNFANAQERLEEIMKEGGDRIEVKACGTCMKERGVAAGEFVDGVNRGTMHDMVNFVASCDRNITF
jgi:tRNA 2-thiouridine synthesizing protein D